MTRIVSTSLMLCWLLTGIGLAQDSLDADPIIYRFSYGFSPGPSLSLGDMGRGSGDPYSLYDNTAPHVAIGSTCSYRITSAISLEMAIDLVNLGSPQRIEKTQQTYVDATFPGHDLIVNRINEHSVVASGLGASYGIGFGPIRLQPTLLACMVDVDTAYSKVLLKRRGTNDYRGILHTASRERTFTVVPAVMIRCAFGDAHSHWGMQLRAAYIHVGVDVEHAIEDETLGETPTVERFTAHHPIDIVNLEIGLYYNLF